MHTIKNMNINYEHPENQNTTTSPLILNKAHAAFLFLTMAEVVIVQAPTQTHGAKCMFFEYIFTNYQYNVNWLSLACNLIILSDNPKNLIDANT